ncbi:hypothetical protein DFJ58DRAFT_465771 [Suillus subalutaceus]|uniref:uncharacterized protein n=1 Tax=Suillus subalutaceus TaxID=48586 RepID=UPI001B8728EC|nr:uncharacterized protein DFJ58DRAFT_465771 [Suillus subalutaceus]KAG1848496.1 hypothetical protein DFJ58DRAFT_465771 [Suillus subalutaceus]
MQTFNSNVDSPSVSATTGGPRNPSDVAIGEDFGLEIVSNSVSCRQLQLVEDKADIVQSHTSLPSLISRLPTEILSEIFLYCLPEDEHLVNASKQAPMLLTNICRRWREIAVGMPRLWCSLQVEFWYPYWQMRASAHERWQARALGYDSWLKRSGGRPLSLKLECGNDWSELQSLLQPYVQQVSSLSLGFISHDGPFMLEDFQSLKELTIHTYVFDDYERAINPSLSKLPVNLRTINMKNVWFNHWLLDSFADSGWDRLTHLEISVDGRHAGARILSLCPNLSSLKMTGSFDLGQTAEPVTHTNLRSLHISWTEIRNLTGDPGPFQVMTLPSLRVLEASHRGPWPHEPFMEFLTRSKCTLERLVLHSEVWTTEEEHAEYATLFPSFEKIDDPYAVFM